MKIGEQLKEHRDRAALTQTELGERAGLNHATISRIESNQAEPRASTIKKIAGALGLEPAELMASPKAAAPLLFDTDAQNDRLALLLAARPREGFEDLYEKIVRRELERLEGIGTPS